MAWPGPGRNKLFAQVLLAETAHDCGLSCVDTLLDARIDRTHLAEQRLVVRTHRLAGFVFCRRCVGLHLQLLHVAIFERLRFGLGKLGTLDRLGISAFVRWGCGL
jgi:hypothetical protein